VTVTPYAAYSAKTAKGVQWLMWKALQEGKAAKKWYVLKEDMGNVY